MKEENEKLKKSTNASGEWNGFGGGKRAIETFSKRYSFLVSPSYF